MVWVSLSLSSRPSTCCLHDGDSAHPRLVISAVLTRNSRGRCRTFERTLREGNEGSNALLARPSACLISGMPHNRRDTRPDTKRNSSSVTRCGSHFAFGLYLPATLAAQRATRERCDWAVRRPTPAAGSSLFSHSNGCGGGGCCLRSSHWIVCFATTRCRRSRPEGARFDS